MPGWYVLIYYFHELPNFCLKNVNISQVLFIHLDVRYNRGVHLRFIIIQF